MNACFLHIFAGIIVHSDTRPSLSISLLDLLSVTYFVLTEGKDMFSRDVIILKLTIFVMVPGEIAESGSYL